MNNNQKHKLIDHMNRFEDDSFDEHAAWATSEFGIQVSARECNALFIDSQFADKSNTLRFVS